MWSVMSTKDQQIRQMYFVILVPFLLQNLSACEEGGIENYSSAVVELIHLVYKTCILPPNHHILFSVKRSKVN